MDLEECKKILEKNLFKDETYEALSYFLNSIKDKKLAKLNKMNTSDELKNINGFVVGCNKLQNELKALENLAKQKSKP